MDRDTVKDMTLAVIALLVLGAVVLGAIFGIYLGVKIIHRSQKRADATNAVKVTAIQIQVAQQQAKVVAAQDATVQAKADQRLIEAKGIRNAQDEISATLTDKYLQHEAIQAQEKLANSPNHTTIYIPSGQNGLPLVGTVDK